MIVIDGITYDVAIVDLQAAADMLDKYAERTNDGVLHRELIGVYDNYDIAFGASYRNPQAFSDLWFKITEPVPWHTVVFPTVFGDRAIEGYFANSKMGAGREVNGINHWKNFTTSFVSRKKRPA